jgi:transposase
VKKIPAKSSAELSAESKAVLSKPRSSRSLSAKPKSAGPVADRAPRRSSKKKIATTSFAGTPIYSPTLVPGPKPDPERRVIGLDLGDYEMTYRVVDGDGRPIAEGSASAEPEEVAVLAGKYPGADVLMEAGGSSPWVQRMLRERGLNAIVAKADILCGRRRRKNDPTDAAALAELMRMKSSLIVEVEHKSEDDAIDFVVLKSRDQLVKMRTASINFVRGVLKSFGVRVGRADADAFGRFAAPFVPSKLRSTIKPQLDFIVSLTARIKAFDVQIKKKVMTKHPQAVALAESVYGVSHIVATAFVLTIFRPDRFRRARDVGPYLGLEPAQKASGTLDPELGISRAGNPFLRKLLVQSAHYLLGPLARDQKKAGDLREWGLGLIRRGGKGAKKRASVAVARRLAVAMLASWKSGTPWDPHYASKKKKPA